MKTLNCCTSSKCPLMNRRCFIKSAGASAFASQLGLFDKASEGFGAPSATSDKPKVLVAFIRPDVKKFWLGWPGASYDIAEREQQYRDIINESAQKFNTDIIYVPKPIYEDESAKDFLNGIKQNPPDGIILMVTNCHHFDDMGKIIKETDAWGYTEKICKKRGKIPTIVFSPMGTSFTGHLNLTRGIDNVYTAATQDLNWLSHGVRMFRTMYDMKQSRICIIAGDKSEDKTLDVIGTTLHYIPTTRFGEVFDKTDTTDEMKQIAEYYSREAKMIIEPSKDDILTAAKNYVVIKHIMEQENCNGFSMDCLGPVGMQKMKPPCMAMSRLQDEGVVGACEADWPAAISQRLTNLLFGKPGFIQDPAPNTVNNTLIGAHCTSPTKLNGFDQPHETFIIRNHSESAMGVSFQVIWKPGQRVTVMKFEEPGKIIAGTGTVISNIDTPPAGGCRSSVELKIDNCSDTRDVKGFHQLFIYGDLALQIKAYCELSGIKYEPIV